MVNDGYIYSNILVGGFSPPLWKMMEWKSVGMMTFPIWWESHKSHVPVTTNQLFTLHIQQPPESPWVTLVSLDDTDFHQASEVCGGVRHGHQQSHLCATEAFFQIEIGHTTCVSLLWSSFRNSDRVLPPQVDIEHGNVGDASAASSFGGSYWPQNDTWPGHIGGKETSYKFQQNVANY